MLQNQLFIIALKVNFDLNHDLAVDMLWLSAGDAGVLFWNIKKYIYNPSRSDIHHGVGNVFVWTVA